MKLTNSRLTVAILIIAVAVAAAAWGGVFGDQKTPAAETASQAQAASQREPARQGAVRVARSATAMPGPVGDREPQTVTVDMTAVELDGQLMDGITYTYWTFDGTVPGQMIRVREGDTVVLRLTNAPDSTQPHSIDLHAVNGPHGGGQATQVMPGETKAFTFKALNPGVYVYHCATPYVPAHIANGMYGLIVVEPASGFSPVDREFYVMQGEFYTDMRPHQKGHASFDGEGMWQEIPNFVVFNGQFNALTGDEQLTAKVGEQVRIFIGNAGPNLPSSFHVIGEIFDVVHKEGASEASTNVQTTLIPAGGATWVEFTVDVPGDYTLVDHSINRALGKGAVATLHVEGPENPEIYHELGTI